MTLTHADWLGEEPFTLVLSAGFFGFYAHAGVILALEQLGLRPRRIVGTSAGAITGGIWAAGVSAPVIVDLLEGMRREDFWDPSWRTRTARSDPGTPLGLLRGRKLDALLRDALATAMPPVDRIEHCSIAFAAVTHELRARQTRVHERGPIRPAIRASCALPIMFGPVSIDGRLHADGGISDRPGFSALAPRERCLYHHLPHRSRWPRLSGDELAERRDTHTRKVLTIDDLPRVHPGALERGALALAAAREHALRWLDQQTTEDRRRP